MTTKVLAPAHPPYITVSRGMAGYFAVMLTWSDEHGGFYEPWTAGCGRYENRADAEAEGQAWAEVEEMEFRA